jgi:hypothetical protein
VTPNPHQTELLHHIRDRGAVPRDQIDGRVLRPLLSNGWASENAGFVRLTERGRSLAAQPENGRGRAGPVAPAPGRLSQAQEDCLRYLLRQTSAVPEEHVDGRVLRALLSRRLIVRSGGWVRPAEDAAEHLSSHARRDRQNRTRRAGQSAQSARAEAVLRAVDQLEAALPLDAELLLGTQPAYADDVIAGLRRFAREMEARMPPPL